jgi:hypothetical protein
MLKIPAEYNRDATSARFKEISRQLPASLLDVYAATREHWWLDQEWIELRSGQTVHQKRAAVHGTLCSIPPRNSNQ